MNIKETLGKAANSVSGFLSRNEDTLIYGVLATLVAIIAKNTDLTMPVDVPNNVYKIQRKPSYESFIPKDPKELAIKTFAESAMNSYVVSHQEEAIRSILAIVNSGEDVNPRIRSYAIEQLSKIEKKSYVLSVKDAATKAIMEIGKGA